MTPLPDGVRRKTLAVGPAGARWLDDLKAIVSELAARWQLDVGEAMDGGSGAFVALATTTDGADVVLKVAIPEGIVGHASFEREIPSSASVRDGGTCGCCGPIRLIGRCCRSGSAGP